MKRPIHALVLLAMTIVLVGVLWQAFDGVGDGAPEIPPVELSPDDEITESYDFVMNVEVRDDGTWRCSVRGEEFTDVETLGRWLADTRRAEPKSTDGALVMTRGPVTGAIVAAIVDACRNAGIAPVRWSRMDTLEER